MDGYTCCEGCFPCATKGNPTFPGKPGCTHTKLVLCPGYPDETGVQMRSNKCTLTVAVHPSESDEQAQCPSCMNSSNWRIARCQGGKFRKSRLYKENRVCSHKVWHDVTSGAVPVCDRCIRKPCGTCCRCLGNCTHGLDYSHKHECNIRHIKMIRNGSHAICQDVYAIGCS